MKFGEVQWAQRDGAPTILTTAVPRGERGVSLLRARFAQAAWFKGTARQHLVFLQMLPCHRLNCRIGERRLVHEPSAGALAICPAGVDCSAESEADMDTVLLAVEPSQLTLVAAEADAPQDRLKERLSGYDTQLLAIVVRLIAEARAGYPNGPLFWSETSDDFMGRLVESHTSSPVRSLRGVIGAPTLRRIREYISEHLAEPIEVAELASVSGRSPFHFTRAFARSVGMTPHRYVVHLRLRAAVARIREGRTRLADVAAETGFSDQSHLSRWIRRVHGVAPSDIGP
ncbi:AraC family transcriptional regulator [Bradyrhizobium sp. I71]|uniref:helix-turn-helix domain-containing protein n=1 Tax=Bradyrhizobium sp. I71 TaxID=2590772 RepID=UPI001EF7C773|nr:AraC family transcriptional regulator [Bradyrhizobium sp. I71]ULK97252.1 helix-turn-helix transcriptional regulator [Bradyrhizobium sp. I71]